MTRDPLLPVRLVDGVWTTEGAVEIGGQTFRAKVTCTPPPAPQIRGIPWPSHGVVIPVKVNADDWREFVEVHNDPITVEHNAAIGETSVSFDAEVTSPGEEPIPVRAVVTWTPPRSIFAAVALDGSGVWALGDTEADARAGALDRREHLRDCARSVDDLTFPPPETDAAWLDGFAIVTLSGTTESLRAIVAALGDVIPWCPADLWDNPEPDKESPCFEMT